MHIDTKHDAGHIGLTSAQLAADIDVHIDQDLLLLGHDVIARQKEETFLQSWRDHWRGAGWSLFISMALWMEGYDTSVVNSFFGLPQFLAKFGVEVNGVLAVPASTQTALGNISTCGQLVGLVITGFCQERYGAKWTYLAGMLFMIVTIFPAVFAQNIATLYGAEFIMGIPWGMFQTLTTAYAMEICPINLRGYLAAWASMGWGGGRFVASGVTRGTLNTPGDWAWRLPYAIQWIWPVPLALTIWLAPESPWWLVRKGRMTEAQNVIRKTARPGVYAPGEVEGYAEYMKHTDALDRAEMAKGSFLDMFRGTNLRRTEIQLGVWAVQIWNVTSLNVEFLEAAGMSTTFSFDFSMIINALSIVGVAVSWGLLRVLGRRPIYNYGTMSIILMNLIIGIMGCIPQTPGVSVGIGSLMALINFAFHFSLGPVCYTIVGEVPAGRLRAQSIALGRFVYVVNSIVLNTLNPYMITVTAWNWGAKSGFFWVGTGLLCILWSWFRMPETGGFSFAELDILFANKVSARKFKSVVITDELAENATRITGEDYQRGGDAVEGVDGKPEEERIEKAQV